LGAFAKPAKSSTTSDARTKNQATLSAKLVMTMDLIKKIKTIKAAEIGLAILLIINLIVHYKSASTTQALPTPLVSVKKPTLLPTTEYITQTGNTVAYQSVDLVARVAGYLDVISFVDGTFLKKGDPLFIIEPEPYLDQLRAANASVDALKAEDEYNKAEYIRQQRMYKANATSLSNVEKWLAKSHESEAEVSKAVANAEIAAINYSYTHIKAPFDGRIGRHLVDIGNFVGNGVATNLATIEQLDPIYVYFNLNELDLIRLRAAARAEGFDPKKIKQIPVYVSLQSDTAFKYEGTLDFINTSLDASTGTMEFRALLPNKETLLVPGLFVQVRVALSKPMPQLTVPDTAVLYDQIGSYVLTVDSAHTVLLKRVVLGSLEQDQRSILKGINAQDNVIVSGLQNATPGHQVAIQPEITEK
jgi:RND family efflux transporter MFP subunit